MYFLLNGDIIYPLSKQAIYAHQSNILANMSAGKLKGGKRMLYKKQWEWNKAVQGMRVLVVDIRNVKTTNGVIKEIKRSNKRRMVDGRPIRSSQVASVTILCDDGSEIVAERDNHQYQITLK